MLTQLRHLGFAKEVTWGTGVAPSVYIPIVDASPSNKIEHVKDEAKRNSISSAFGAYPTKKFSELEIETNFYINEIGHFLLAALGKVTTTGASAPYTHKFQEDKTARSLTVQHYDSVEERRYAGMIVDELSIKWDAENLVSVSVKLQGKYSTTTATTTPSIAAGIKSLVGIFSSLKIGAVANVNMIGGEITIKRENKLLHGGNQTQEATRAVVGAISVTGKLTFEPTDTTEFAAFEAQAYKTLEITLGNDASAKCIITLTNAWIEEAELDYGDQNMKVDWTFAGHYNATDAGQVAIQLINTQTTY